MGAVQEKIKIRHGIRHDEKDADAREQEGDEKAEQGSARQPVRGLARYMGFGSHKFAVGLSGFGERVEQIERRSGRESDRRTGWQLAPRPLSESILVSLSVMNWQSLRRF